MAAKSEFETILSRALNNGASDSDLSRGEYTTGSSDYLETLFASMGPLKVQFFGGEKAYRSQQEAKVTPKFTKLFTVSPMSQVKSVPETPSQPANRIKPTIKRKFTFEQERALGVFVKFGEKDLDAYSTDEDIKAAYRRLAKKYHPDLKKSSTGEAFKLIAIAYQKILP